MAELLQSATWLSSFPKSGNTWLRLLLEAYHCNGALDINNTPTSSSDGGATLVQSVSPLKIEDLGFRGEALLRPAALLNLLACLIPPTFIKTHWANIQIDGLPPFIPKDFTKNAIHVVRDPRSVLSSFADYYKLSINKAVTAMNTPNFTIGGSGRFSQSMVSSWSNHVASWVAETAFPVHVVKYEDMIDDTARELTEVLEFLGYEVNPTRVNRAVKIVKLSKLKEAEKKNGFRESADQNTKFFGKGGTRWKEELGPKWISKIENDHGKVMKDLGYL